MRRIIDADKLIADLLQIAEAGYVMVSIDGVIKMIEASRETIEDDKTE